MGKRGDSCRCSRDDSLWTQENFGFQGRSDTYPGKRPKKSECSAVVLEIEKTNKSYLFHHLKIVVEWVPRLCSEYNFIKLPSPPYIVLHLILTFLFGWKSFH